MKNGGKSQRNISRLVKNFQIIKKITFKELLKKIPKYCYSIRICIKTVT